MADKPSKLKIADPSASVCWLALEICVEQVMREHSSPAAPSSLPWLCVVPISQAKHDPFAHILDFIDRQTFLLLQTPVALETRRRPCARALAASAGLPTWIKLEIIQTGYLLPDPVETLAQQKFW